jgi:ribonuclease HII
MKRPSKNNALSWHYEQAARTSPACLIAGIDEAGRGCLAGPVVAAAVIFLQHTTWPEHLNDSKKLTRSLRKQLFEELTQLPQLIYGIGQASPQEIDHVNILQATFLAMNRAVQQLAHAPDFILVDGSQKPKGLDPASLRCIIKGDGISPSIAAASILAKETRDRIMEQAELDYPCYGFTKHKGYGTHTHLLALQARGACAIHRHTFAPIRQFPVILHRH